MVGTGSWSTHLDPLTHMISEQLFNTWTRKRLKGRVWFSQKKSIWTFGVKTWTHGSYYFKGNSWASCKCLLSIHVLQTMESLEFSIRHDALSESMINSFVRAGGSSFFPCHHVVDMWFFLFWKFRKNGCVVLISPANPTIPVNNDKRNVLNVFLPVSVGLESISASLCFRRSYSMKKGQLERDYAQVRLAEVEDKALEGSPNAQCMLRWASLQAAMCAALGSDTSKNKSAHCLFSASQMVQLSDCSHVVVFLSRLYNTESPYNLLNHIKKKKGKVSLTSGIIRRSMCLDSL